MDNLGQIGRSLRIIGGKIRQLINILFCDYRRSTISLGPVYEFVCISFRTDNLNCFRAS